MLVFSWHGSFNNPHRVSMLGKFPLVSQNYKQGRGCAKFLAEIGLNFILIAVNTKI